MKPLLPSGPTAALREVAGALAGLVYPSLCLGCDVRLPAPEPEMLLCPACVRAIPRAEVGALEKRLARLPEGPIAFAAARALWLFDDGGTVQRVQHVAKYGNRPSLGVRLGRAIGRAWAEAGQPSPDLVVPVPLHRLRRLERGYNQSHRLALGISEALSVPIRDDLLTRRRATRSQTNLSQAARWTNVADAFALTSDEAVAGRRVLLVDDVVTTGATAVAAAAPLRAAGARADLAVLACTRD